MREIQKLQKDEKTWKEMRTNLIELKDSFMSLITYFACRKNNNDKFMDSVYQPFNLIYGASRSEANHSVATIGGPRF